MRFQHKVSIRERHDMKNDRELEERFFISGQRVPRDMRIHLRPGACLGDRFRVIEHLGCGQHGDVYKARDMVSEEDVAIKCKDIGAEGGKDSGSALVNEMRASRKICDHQHILRANDLYEVSFEGTRLLFLSLEYADGGSLRERITKNSVGEQRITKLLRFRELCLGLDAAHNSGILHLDIKPENGLIVNGTAKVADFGQTYGTTGNGIGCRPREMGTPEYMSPEQFSAHTLEELKPAADIYSVGVFFYEWISPDHELPFVGSVTELEELHRRVPPPPLPGASEMELRIVSRCLAKDPSQRYATMGELLADIEQCLPPDIQAQSSATPFETLWPEACAAAKCRDFISAENLCREIVTQSPHHAEARELLAFLQANRERAGEFYSVIRQDMATRDLEELVVLLNEAVRLYPDHRDGHLVQINLLVKVQKYRHAMTHGAVALDKADWHLALAHFQEAQRLAPNASGVKESVTFTSRVLENVNFVRGLIDREIEAGNREKALAWAHALDRYTAIFAHDIHCETELGSQ